MSDGRLILGLGAGWYEREYQAYGYHVPVGRATGWRCWTRRCRSSPACGPRRRCTFDGHHVHLDGAYCEPQAAAYAPPPILVGGGGEQVTLRIAARHADMTNWQVGLEAFVHKSGLLARYCEEVDRDPDDGRAAPTGRTACIVDTEAELPGLAATRPAAATCGAAVPPTTTCGTTWSAPSTRWPRRPRPTSTPGCSEFILWFRDAPSDRSLTAWMEGVVPRLHT